MKDEISTKLPQVLVLQEFQFHRQTREIEDGKGRRTALRPQSARVLQLLFERAPNVVSKEDLIEQIWGNVHVTDDSLVQCISQIRRAFGSDGGQLIKTIPKVGYCLDLPSRVERDDALANESGDGEPPLQPGHVRGISHWVLIMASVTGLFVAAWLLWGLFLPSGTASVGSDMRHRLAVLPFENLSADVSEDYFSEGLSEDLVVSLSQLSDLRVVSTGAVRAFRSDQGDSRSIAAHLKVDRLLMGSVRRRGDSLRLTVQLVDGQSGETIWAEGYDGTRKDIFAFQDAVLEELLSNLSVRLSERERQRLGVYGTKDVKAHDAYLLGRKLEGEFTRDANLKAEEAFKRAIERDPDFAAAYSHLAQVYSFRVEFEWSSHAPSDIERAFAAAKRGLALDGDLPYAHFSLARLYTRSFSGRQDLAIPLFQKAIALDPNYVNAYVFLANALIFDGQAEKAVPLIEAAFERHPLPPFWYYQARGMADYFLGAYDKAIVSLKQAIAQSPKAPFPYRFLMASYGQLGEREEAEWIAFEYEALGRTVTIKALMESASISDQAYRDLYRQGFEKAGLASE